MRHTFLSLLLAATLAQAACSSSPAPEKPADRDLPPEPPSQPQQELVVQPQDPTEPQLALGPDSFLGEPYEQLAAKQGMTACGDGALCSQFTVDGRNWERKYVFVGNRLDALVTSSTGVSSAEEFKAVSAQAFNMVKGWENVIYRLDKDTVDKFRLVNKAGDKKTIQQMYDAWTTAVANLAAQHKKVSRGISVFMPKNAFLKGAREDVPSYEAFIEQNDTFPVNIMLTNPGSGNKNIAIYTVYTKLSQTNPLD